MGSYYWADDIGYCEYWVKTHIITDRKLIKKVERLKDCLSDCSYGFITDKICIVLTKPKVRVNNQWFLHSDQFKAIEWKDGEGEYFLNGVKFPEDLWKKVTSREMSTKDIMSIVDIDQRTQAMKYAKEGPREFFKLQGGSMVDSFEKMAINGEMVRYELWTVPTGEVFSQDVHFALYNCPSTKKEYVSGVPSFKSITEAMAWKSSDDDNPMTADEWKLLVPLVNES